VESNQKSQLLNAVLAPVLLLVCFSCTRERVQSLRAIKPAEIDIRKASKVRVPGVCEVRMNRGLYVEAKPAATHADVQADAFLTKDSVGTPQLLIKWTPEAAKSLKQHFAGWRGLVAYVLNGRVASYAKLKDEISWEPMFVLLDARISEV